MTALRRHILSTVAFVLWAGLILSSAPARAQLAANVSVESDYRFRGLSLSNEQPDVRLNLSYDSPSLGKLGEAYAGISVIGAQLANGQGPRPGYQVLGYVDYAGYVIRPKQGPALEVGFTNMHVQARYSYDFSEIYAGIITDSFSARLYYSPHYFGHDVRTVYTDFNGSHRLSGDWLSGHWRLFGHVGVLTPLSGALRAERYDVRVGVAVSMNNYEVQMGWTRTNPLRYENRFANDKSDFVVSASCFF